MKALLTFIILILLFNSCKKDNNEYGKNSVYMEARKNANDGLYIRNLKDNAISEVANEYELTGSLFTNGSDFYYPASGGYYKNGSKVELPEAAITISIFVKNNNVYTAGYLKQNGACYWKNSQLIRLANNTNDTAYEVSKIIVYENDVYVGGEMHITGADAHKVIYWKNNTLHILGEGDFENLATDGDNVYVTASIREMTDYHGFYWKNDEKRKLYTYNNSEPQSLTSIFVDGKDVYITGVGDRAPLYWKNDQLVGETMSCTPVGVTIQNKEIWVLTNAIYYPSSGPVSSIVLWKNNDSINLGSGFALRIAPGN